MARSALWSVKFDLGTFDLILVDDSTSAEERAATIRAVVSLLPAIPGS